MSSDEPVTEPVTEQVTEPVTEQVTEQVTEPVTEENEQHEPFETHAPKKKPSQFGRAQDEPEFEELRPRKQPSALGQQQPKKTPSMLQRLDLAPGDQSRADEVMPPRSPVGAMRSVSGITFRPPPPAEKKEGDAASPFTEVEVVDDGVQWHNLPLDEVFEMLKSNPDGLTTEKQAAQLEEYGLNQITPPKKTHWFIKFLLSLVVGFQLMMNVGAVLCFIVYGISAASDPDSQTLALGVMLIVVCFLTSIFQTYQEGKADKIMEELRALAADGVWVYRDGQLCYVDSAQIVPGDVVKVTAGEKVPADVRILSATDLKVNNASLTGENVDIKLGPDAKHNRLYEAKNIARSGCNFTSGNGVVLVFATGDHTFFGGIAKSTTEIERPDTLMKREVNRMIVILSILAVLLGIIFFILSMFNGFTWIQSVAFAIGIIVANVPEGLLSQLVVTLALTAKNLQKVDVLVSNLEIIETLGAITVICSDKTGTLTCNRMTVSHVVYDGEIHTTPNTPNMEDDNFKQVDTSEKFMQDLQRVITLNTDAVFIESSKVGDDVLKWDAKGDASESALVKFVQPMRDIVEMRDANKRLASIPFNSSNKWMLSINQPEDESQPVRLLVKGAPERVLAMCSTAQINGQEVPMDAGIKQHFEDLNTQLAKRGERVLAFAQLDLDKEQYTPDYAYDTDCDPPNFPTKGLCLVGYVSLIDPPRPTVKKAVDDCQRAGIKVFMVTGDHPVTALAISKSIGIVTKPTAAELEAAGEEVDDDYRGSIAVHGSEMTTFTQDDWDFVLEHDEIVFARTMPQQKQDIVGQLNQLGHVVAMTGDGVNDAPALKAANVGVAMGSGASVAKEAAQIIVMKDDFGSIVDGIRAGRLVFGTMKKVITYVLVSNTPQILPFLFFVAAKIPLGIETIVILCIDLGTDILPAIALAYEEEEDETMSKPPRGPHDHLVTPRMILVTYGTVGIFHTFASYFGFYWVFLDKGFTVSNMFGAGLGFRDDFSDLDDDRKKDFFELCLENTYYLKNANLLNPATCTTDFASFRQDVLGEAQAAFFMAIIWGQIANIFIRKTFSESIMTFDRLFKNRHVLGGIVFELCLIMMLIYIPGLNGLFMMRPLAGEYMFCTIWYIPFLILYDEIRKFFVRLDPEGCVAAVTQF